FADDSIWGFAEIARVARASAAAVARIPGVAEHPAYPTVLACAAMRAGWQNDLDGMRRYLDEAAAAERLGVEQNPSLVGARGWAQMVEGDLGGYQRTMEEMAAIWRARSQHARVALSLASSAMSRALEGDDMTLALDEIEEALAL